MVLLVRGGVVCLMEFNKTGMGCVKTVLWVLGGHVTGERREGGERWCAVQWCARCLWYFAPWDKRE